jgi:hypothetical protein
MAQNTRNCQKCGAALGWILRRGMVLDPRRPKEKCCMECFVEAVDPYRRNLLTSGYDTVILSGYALAIPLRHKRRTSWTGGTCLPPVCVRCERSTSGSAACKAEHAAFKVSCPPNSAVLHIPFCNACAHDVYAHSGVPVRAQRYFAVGTYRTQVDAKEHLSEDLRAQVNRHWSSEIAKSQTGWFGMYYLRIGSAKFTQELLEMARDVGSEYWKMMSEAEKERFEDEGEETDGPSIADGGCFPFNQGVLSNPFVLSRSSANT